MKKTMEKMKSDFAALRTGRASIALVEGLRVESYGTDDAASISWPASAFRTRGPSRSRPWDISQTAEHRKSDPEIGARPDARSTTAR